MQLGEVALGGDEDDVVEVAASGCSPFARCLVPLREPTGGLIRSERTWWHVIAQGAASRIDQPAPPCAAALGLE
jgi:hypothetical protein